MNNLAVPSIIPKYNFDCIICRSKNTMPYPNSFGSKRYCNACKMNYTPIMTPIKTYIDTNMCYMLNSK